LPAPSERDTDDAPEDDEDSGGDSDGADCDEAERVGDTAGIDWWGLIARWSGLVGYEPTGSLRELKWAVDEVERSRWDRAAEQVAAIYNAKCGKLVISASQINPYRQKQRKTKPPDLSELTYLLET